MAELLLARTKEPKWNLQQHGDGELRLVQNKPPDPVRVGFFLWP